MSLSNDQVGHIARLARIAVSASELEATRDKLNGIFGLIEQMQAVDTSGVEPLYTPLAAAHAAALRLRDDVVTEADARSANQRSAPAVEDGLFLVPKVIE